MTDIELLWQLAEMREISRRQTEAKIAQLVEIVEAYHGLVEVLLADRPELRETLESMKTQIEQYQEQNVDEDGESW